MEVGRVKSFDKSQGYGYIDHIDGRKVYFHYTAIVRDGYSQYIENGMQVEFDLLTTVSGYEAANVKVFD